MSLSCLCPSPTAIGNIPAQPCPENILQIQKFAIQRAGDKFDGTAGNDVTLLADWQTRTSATGDTHIVVTPFVFEAVITPGEAITNGGVVYLFNEDGKIILWEKTTGVFEGIPISSFFVGDQGNEGFATKDASAVSFNIKKDWSKYKAISVPSDFDPLTGL